MVHYYVKLILFRQLCMQYGKHYMFLIIIILAHVTLGYKLAVLGLQTLSLTHVTELEFQVRTEFSLGRGGKCLA